MKKTKGLLLMLLVSLLLLCVGCSSSKQSNPSLPVTSVSNTTEKSIISKEKVKDVYVRSDLVFKYKDWIYYYTTLEDTKGIYRVKSDGSSKEFVLKPTSRVQSLLVTDKYIYYIDGEGSGDYLLMKYDLELKKVEQVASGSVKKFGMSGNFIYLAERSIKRIDTLTNDVKSIVFNTLATCEEIYDVNNNEIISVLYSNEGYIFSKIKINEKLEVVEEKIVNFTTFGFQPNPCDGQDFMIGTDNNKIAYKLPFKDILTLGELSETNIKKFEQLKIEQNFEYVSFDGNKSFYINSLPEKPEDRKIVMCDIKGNNPQILVEGTYFRDIIVKDNCIFVQNGNFKDDELSKGIYEKTVDIDGKSYHIFVIDRHLGF